MGEGVLNLKFYVGKCLITNRPLLDYTRDLKTWSSWGFFPFGGKRRTESQSRNDKEQTRKIKKGPDVISSQTTLSERRLFHSDTEKDVHTRFETRMPVERILR